MFSLLKQIYYNITKRIENDAIYSLLSEHKMFCEVQNSDVSKSLSFFLSFFFRKRIDGVRISSL